MPSVYGYSNPNPKVGDLKSKPTLNHHVEKSLSKGAKTKIASLHLARVAGNIYECPSTKDFWKVKESGAVVRLSSSEVDNGESINLPVSTGSFADDVLNGLEL